MVEVKVRDRGMSAAVNVTPEEGESLSVEYIKNMLRLEGIQAGIQESAIKNLLDNQLYGLFVTVAEGKEAVNGTDGYYDFHFVVPQNNKAPRVREDGSVDYTRAITNVNKGDLVAEYHPRTNGVFGYNVFATMLQPRKGKELRPFICKGIRVDENKYYAEKDGFITMENNQLHILDVLEINGDVDQTVGNLDFNGDIKVHGSILSNLTVSARGSLIVDGVIESANVKVDEDIFVGKGIHGRSTGKVEAAGSVCATFIDHSFVSAGRDIKIDYAVSSVLEAGGMVRAEGRYGSVVGGTITAAGGVEANTFGNNAELPTKISVGITEENQTEDRILRAAPVIIHKAAYPGVSCRLSGVLETRLQGNREFRNIGGLVESRAIGAFSLSDIEGTGPVEPVVEEKELFKILVVDDDPKILRLVNGMLHDEYQVAVAGSGAIARKFLERKKVDLILLDYMMPEENGVEVLKSFRANTETQNIPVVFLTGLQDRNKILECLSLKPAGYIPKPVDSKKLKEKLKVILATG